MNILFIVPYPEGEAPSQRFRFEQYFPALKEAGHTYAVAPFLDKPTWQILYQPGRGVHKALGILKGLLRRLALLPSLPAYDWVFIHREAAPLGPPLFEWLITKVFRKRVVYDFDDAIWLPNTSEQNRMAARLKWHQKVAAICRWSYRVSCGNEYLRQWASQYNANAVYMPTTLDTERVHNRLKEHNEKEEVVIGWTGTHSTLKYLKPLEGVLQTLAARYPRLRFLIISNQPPTLDLPRLEYRPWNKETEIEDLLRMDIGIMPLTEDPWSEGKCGFKALQYMALGIPAVVSPVGVNREMIQEHGGGLSAQHEQEWGLLLERLIPDGKARSRMGARGRKTVETSYSVSAWGSHFLRLFELEC
ncbi:glycosyltransferase family 4 protein [Cesiribacter andamanensis]|uniref:Glycosyl transferases group 1 n=1 Tax=Cesiribacter andamanensis AMV16 TaxID=1279009 RepID=M7N6P1_9BACT|nr:glycosyltransferase family 4 protein [Cesiribacter andamanensis]EMR04258.1 Glycosyl transferases group 1 [Cesiribacter andamanensis AMV16]